MTALLAAIKAVTEIADSPESLRAIRIFSDHVLRGQSIREALVKTAEIMAAEALLG